MNRARDIRHSDGPSQHDGDKGTDAGAARIALVAHVAELQAELACITCPSERRTIAAELQAAKAKVAKLSTEG